ncbi:NUDIX hydrolase [Paucihalobacter sp.]|uniref:NUDIX hydrolase n=1 Tax=Paucihalobacter sp. TaxID=2850405 RepID=UPI002FE034B1
MIKVFVGDKPIILTTEVLKEHKFKNYLLNSFSIGHAIMELNKSKMEKIHLIHDNPDEMLPKFLKLLPVVKAAGGKVVHENGKVLFIYRNDKWDLPKGRIEKKESIETAAIREVEEETGVNGLKITKPLDTTYHIFKRNGQHAIKITYWFEMITNYEGLLIPQLTEGITKVSWLDDQSTSLVLDNSYANIKSLIV